MLKSVYDADGNNVVDAVPVLTSTDLGGATPSALLPPSQNAVKSYVDLIAAGLFQPQGSIDCSTNPNYPASYAYDVYLVSVAGKIGGAGGLDVQAGDLIFCWETTGAGTQEAVGSKFNIVQYNLIAASESVAGYMQFVASGGTTALQAVQGSDARLAVATAANRGTVLLNGAGKVLDSVESFAFRIGGVAAASDFTNLFRWPYAGTILGFHVSNIGGTSITGDCDICDTAGAAVVNAFSSADLTANAGACTENGALAHTAFTAGQHLGWHTESVSGTNTSALVTVRFKYT